MMLLAIVTRAESGWLNQIVTRGDALALGSLFAVLLTGTALGVARPTTGSLPVSWPPMSWGTAELVIP
jgi:hypothetical protein